MASISEKIPETTELEGICMEVAEGNEKAKHQLIDILKTCPPNIPDWPEETREVFQSAFDLILESIRQTNTPVDLYLLFLCLRNKYDRADLRDAFANAVRNCAEDYSDPAGLLAALKIHDNNCAAEEIAWRWACFSHLAPERPCFHEAHAVGKIIRVDDLANRVNIAFERHTELNLEHALGKLVVVESNSTLEQLLDHKLSPDELADTENNPEALSEMLYGNPSLKPQAVKALLKNAGIDLQRASTGRSKTSTSSSESAPQKNVAAARSLVELLGTLRNEEDIGEWGTEEQDNVARILDSTASRTDQAENFTHAVSTVYARVSPEVFGEILKSAADKAKVWQDVQTFVRVTNKLRSQILPYWLCATLQAPGSFEAKGLFTALPLRIYPYLEKAYKKLDLNPSPWLESMLRKSQKGQASADNVVWLWKKGMIDDDSGLDIQSVLRLLQTNTAGAFKRGQKDLKRLLMEDEKFQSYLLGHGARRSVERGVRTVRHSTALDSGERQSLLVRIVRLFPESKDLVEQRTQPSTKDEIPPITSIRSYEARRQELEDIINRKIPQNARDIAEARSHGDLRENAEYKAAKEEQQRLNQRRGELENALHEVQPTDFEHVTVKDTIIPGCGVRLHLSSGSSRDFLVLGLWDGDPENNVLSGDTPLGRRLVGCSVGQKVTLPSGEEGTIEQVYELPPEWQEYLKNTEEIRSA